MDYLFPNFMTVQSKHEVKTAEMGN